MGELFYVEFDEKSGLFIRDADESNPSSTQFQEAINALFCSSREKFHTVVLMGVRNTSVTLQNVPMKFLA